MLKNQVLTLEKSGMELLAKASQATKAADIREFTGLGLQCLAESRDIAATLSRNSVLFYLEIGIKSDPKCWKYQDYCDFCYRNGCEIVSEFDFESIATSILEEVGLVQEQGI